MSNWKKAIKTEQLQPGQRGCVKFGETQVALFHLELGQWYAVQNRCPHKGQDVISRGISGDKKGDPMVACALHKNQFSLKTGACLSGDLETLVTYPVKLEGDVVWIEVTP